MGTQPIQRPRWQIDRLLETLVGLHVRVHVKAFSPVISQGRWPTPWLRVNDLYLPDNSQAGGLPVFFEGRLDHFERHIGVVMARLDAPQASHRAPEGAIHFRGKTAVILRGPAVVELAFPFRIERLPDDPENYWRDLRLPIAQFEFPFAMGQDADRNDRQA